MTTDDSWPDNFGDGFEMTIDPRVDGPFRDVLRAFITSHIVNRSRRLLLGGGSFALRATDPSTGAPSTVEALRQSPHAFRIASLEDPDNTRRLIEQEFSEEASALLGRAEAVARGEVVLLGQRWPSLEERAPDWHRDPSGEFCWNANTPGRAVLDRYPQLDADPKQVWEPARFQFAAPLAQAYWLTGEERWAESYLALVESFLDANPFARGIHWSSAMEVALRAFSWTWALGHLRDSEAISESLWRRWQASLNDHARYVRLCLEFEVLGNGNHYVANLLGLASTAKGLPGHASSRRRASLARRFEREAVDETLGDGENFEGSTAYHQFATEMFVWAAALGFDTRPRFRSTVRSQLEFLNALVREDGTIPRVGDDDSGRILAVSEEDAFAVLDVGFALIPDAPRRAHGETPTLDLVWAGGVEAVERFRADRPTLPMRTSRSFSESGIHIATHDKSQVCMTTGPARVRAAGGHMHADLLSISWHVEGHELICDPGTLAYAGGLENRNQLRGSAAHSTAHVEGEELRELVGGFQSGPAPRARMNTTDGGWEASVRFESGFAMRRRIRFGDPHALAIEDDMIRPSGERIEWALILGLGEVERLEESPSHLHLRQASPAGELELRIEAGVSVDWSIDSLVGSEAYGVPRELQRIRARSRACEDLELRCRIALAPHP